MRRRATWRLGGRGPPEPAGLLAFADLLNEPDAGEDLVRLAADGLKRFGVGAPGVAEALGRGLIGPQGWRQRRATLEVLAVWQLPPDQLTWSALMALVAHLHEPRARALAGPALARQLEGRPLRGYQWVPLCERAERRARRRRLASQALLAAALAGLVLALFRLPEKHWLHGLLAASALVGGALGHVDAVRKLLGGVAAPSRAHDGA